MNTKETNVASEVKVSATNNNFFTSLDRSLFNSEKGSKSDIYKEKAYRDILNLKSDDLLTADLKKTARRNLRKLKENFAITIVSLNNKKETKKLTDVLNQFKTFYEIYFSSNDYSIQSLISANSSSDNKALMQKALDVIIKEKH